MRKLIYSIAVIPKRQAAWKMISHAMKKESVSEAMVYFNK